MLSPVAVDDGGIRKLDQFTGFRHERTALDVFSDCFVKVTRVKIGNITSQEGQQAGLSFQVSLCRWPVAQAKVRYQDLDFRAGQFLPRLVVACRAPGWA